MRTLWRILHRTIFWSYERGAWQYDVAVVAILVFVLLTPRRWFQDEPQVGMPAASDHVKEIASDEASRTYRVDARVLAPPTRTPELANDLHNAIQKAVPELQGHRFQILRIEPLRDASGTVTAYEVQVKR